MNSERGRENNKSVHLGERQGNFNMTESPCHRTWRHIRREYATTWEPGVSRKKHSITLKGQTCLQANGKQVCFHLLCLTRMSKLSASPRLEVQTVSFAEMVQGDHVYAAEGFHFHHGAEDAKTDLGQF